MFYEAQKYIEYLKSYPLFEVEKGNADHLFEYVNRDDENLITLCNTYRIAEIALGRDTFEKVKALMDWVHKELFFVGENVYPPFFNSLSILSNRKKGALFCTYQAIVLNEALLSIGIKSRLLWCFPYEFDSDCHVGVTVYLPEINDWIFFDPTFNTFFHDQDGIPLSIVKVREVYKNGELPGFRHIEINKTWSLTLNGFEFETYDKWYSMYMAKNCFRFSSPLQSSFGYLSREDAITVFLNPSDYVIKNEYDHVQHPQTAIYTSNINVF
ncbi:transglutaminase-like domain-containing protein [Paenibacillus marinisediminis]